MKRLLGGMIVGAAVALGGAGGGGCMSWASYPAGPGEVAVKNPNDPAIVDVMVVALEWVVRKYPPEAGAAPAGEGGEPRLAVNLPPGVRPSIYQGVARRVGHGAVPLSRDRADLPVYHVAQVRIRGDEAAVDVLRPATELGEAPGGGAVYQEIRINLRGGMQPWKMMSHREWTAGTVSRMPEMNYLEPEAAPAAPASPPAGTVDPAR